MCWLNPQIKCESLSKSNGEERWYIQIILLFLNYFLLNDPGNGICSGICKKKNVYVQTLSNVSNVCIDSGSQFDSNFDFIHLSFIMFIALTYSFSANSVIYTGQSIKKQKKQTNKKKTVHSSFVSEMGLCWLSCFDSLNTDS